MGIVATRNRPERFLDLWETVACFSKVPKSFSARKAIRKTSNRLFRKACYKGNTYYTAKFRFSRRLRFEDTKRNMSAEMRPKSFGTFEKQVPGPGSCLLKILCGGKLSWVVETCWKDVESMLKEFKSLLFSKMFGMLKQGWSHLPRSFNIVEQAHAQLRRRNHGHHGCKDGSKARQFCVWLIVRATLSLGEIT